MIPDRAVAGAAAFAAVSPAATSPAAAPSALASPVLEADGLVRQFAGRRAVDGVSVSVRSGECLALFGPNGAGKTTLLRLLAGLLKPTAGHARIAGVTLPGGAAARALVGIISHQSLLYPALTARENVEFFARLYGVPDARAAALAAIVHSPKVLLLDEPYSGLDDTGAAALTGALGALSAAGAAVVLVTHNIGEGMALATHVAMLRAGRLVRHEPRAGLDAAEYAVIYRELAQGAA